jgi:cysteine-rich repeat protein
VLQDGEACDDGNPDDTDECLATCLLASCGDGAVQAGVEDCDDGNQDDSDACLVGCIPAKCGDGAVQSGVEECDDGNLVDTDECLNACVGALCGDKVVQEGVEACDDGNPDDTDACLSTCVAASCGDGKSQAGVEVCDDGNKLDEDGCTSACTVPKSCKELLAAVPAAKSGVFVIDPDGLGGAVGFPVFCDMMTAGGGWTLVERSPFGGQTIGKALYGDVPVNPADPANVRHRLAKPTMKILRDAATDMRIDCRGSDYLLTAASNLFNGEGGPNTCFNWTKVLYKEAQLKGNLLLNKTICTWHVGTSEGCAGAWHIDEFAQTGYNCGLANYPWKGVAITSNSADTFATDANTPDGANPVHDCHKNGAARWVMVR